MTETKRLLTDLVESINAALALADQAEQYSVAGVLANALQIAESALANASIAGGR